MKQEVLLLFGGTSSEHEVSLASAAAVLRAVDPARHRVWPVGISRKGGWWLCAAGADAIEKGEWEGHPGNRRAALSPCRGAGLLLEDPQQVQPIDVCLPVLHGRCGEDGTVQGLAELAGIPLAGSGSLASALCMDKDVAHRLAETAGIHCPRSVAVHRGDEPAEAARQALLRMERVPLPWFVKPAREGSSFGISRIGNPRGLAKALEAAFAYDDKAVVEEGIEGIEVGCAVLDDGRLFTGVPDAVQLAGGFFDFHEKYTLETARLLLPAPIPAEAARRVREASLELFRLFGCSGFARVDFFYTPEGEVVFNEINTIPGMTAHSRYPRMLAQAGVSFGDMVSAMLGRAS